MAKRKKILIIVLIALIVIIDQAIKIWTKTHLVLGENIKITEWFYIIFVENNQLVNNVFLIALRFIFFSLISYWLYLLIKRNFKIKYIICLSLVVAGALGNLIDNIFYGVIFDSSNYWQVASLFPREGGYSTWFYGQNIEMFYFPIITIGDTIFCRSIFNFADLTVSIGTIMGVKSFRLFIFVNFF